MSVRPNQGFSRWEKFVSSFIAEDVDDGAADPSICNPYNTTSKKIITNVYEGIPENLLLNFLGWLLLLLLFAVLRKRAWNYGRIALVQKTEEKWTQLFYGNMDELVGTSEVDSVSSLETSMHIDRGFCSWITAVFRVKDENILQRCGPDAVQYLSFQRHILFYVSIVMVISLTVVLPVNFQGSLEGSETSFGHTTLSNLNPESPLLWVHVTLAILYLPLAVFVLRHFSTRMQLQQERSNVSCTLMVTNIPRQHCDSADLYRHFREAYPEMQVQDITLAYDIAKLSKLDQKREKVCQAKAYCENYTKRTGMRLDMRPYACGNVCGCCNMFGCPTVDAIEFYSGEEEVLQKEVEEERIKALRIPLGIAFVTMATPEMARRVRADHHLACGTRSPGSSLGASLKPHQWSVDYAPTPGDLYWENLSVPSRYWYLKAVLINAFMFIVLFFLTTPAVVINFLDAFNVQNEIGQMNPLISEFLPTLLLWTVAALLPVLVSYSDQWLSHWTRSEQNHSIMHKTFIFLLFMVLILPSLGLASAQAFFMWTLHPRNGTYRWDCVFLPDKGAFFVNYVTTSAFIGTGLELIRFPELFVYVLQLCLARSVAETDSVKKAILWEFPFGVQYAWMLLIFVMTLTYSLTCPLITPFGLLYLILKHLVDKYNLYFAYGPSKISPRIHMAAINIVLVSVGLLQVSFLAWSLLRSGFSSLSIVSFAGVTVTTLFLLGQICLNCCQGLNPICYQNPRCTPGPSAESSPVHRFMPPVLKPPTDTELAMASPTDGVPVAPRTYGTHSDGDVMSPDGILAFQPTSNDRSSLYQAYDGASV